MKKVALLILGGLALAMTACSTETVYVHHHHVGPPPEGTIPGEPSRMPNPGAPESFSAESR